MENKDKKKFSLKDKYHIYKNRLFYKIDQIKSINYKEYIFIDFGTFILFVCVAILNVVFNIGKIGLPHTFPPLSICIEILETLVRSIVVLLSIIFSFTLLSFQIFNKYFGRFAFTDFFKRKHLKVMFTLFILNVSFLIYSISYLKSCRDPNTVTTYGMIVFIESILFSVLLVISIFPVMIDLLSKSQSRHNIKSLFESTENILVANYLFFDDNIKDDEYENNPFKIISEIGLAAIKDFDNTTFEILVRSIYQRSKSIFEGEKLVDEKRVLYSNFTDNLKDFFSFAVKEKNSSAQLRIITSRWGIEKEAVKQSFLIDYKERYFGWDFNRDIENFYNKTIQNNEDQISAAIVDRYIDYMSMIVEDLLPLTFQYNFEKPYDNIEDTNMITGQYSLIDTIAKIATNTKKTVIIQSISNFFITLDITIVESQNTPETKNYLLQINNIHKEKLMKYLVENAQIKNIEFQYYPFGIGNSMELKQLNTSVILSAELNAVDYLFANKLLNNFVLNDLKSNAFHIIENFSDNISLGKKLLKVILTKFDHIRNLIKQDDTLANMNLYINLERYLKYIKSIYTQKGVGYELSNHISDLLAKFTYVEEFTEKLNQAGFIQNTSMF